MIDCQDSAFLVTSRPGRGKTTVALWFAENLIRRGMIGPTQRILFLTFSRNAVYQISTASGSLLEEATRSRIDIATYHSFMWSLLQNFGRYAGLPRQLQLVWDTKSKAASYGVCSDSENLPRFLACAVGGITYDCFAPLATQLLGSVRLRQALSSLYPVVIIDEFQDTDDQQWKFIKLLTSFSRLCCLADPDQMIHRFRGARDTRLDEFIEQRQAKVYSLQEKCLRTNEHELLDFAEAILDNALAEDRAFGWSKRFLRGYPGPNARAYWLKRVLKEFYDDYRKRGFTDMPTVAIATYANQTVGLIRTELAKKGGKIEKSYSCALLESDHDQSLDDLTIHLAFWIALRREEDVKISMRMIGVLVSPEDIDRASGAVKLLFDPEAILSGELAPKHTAKIVSQTLIGWRQVRSSCFDVISESIFLLNQLSTKIAPLANKLRSPETKERFGFLCDLASTCNEGKIEEQLGRLKWKLNNIGLHQSVLQRAKPIRGRVVTTTHKLKGKEFDYVMLVAMPKEKFYSAGESEVDGRRLLYVGLTRARYDARILYMASAPPQLFALLHNNTQLTTMIIN
ncbi:MAG TPA: UvrD-helicase domain-containing protein [Syntrophorhabdaceae bacterium]|nr:UvrD-helicase domain-containing protein [Syntrophorhabdaceae bacterium]